MKKTTIQLRLRGENGSKFVSCNAYTDNIEGLAVHKEHSILNGWAVTHIASGITVVTGLSLRRLAIEAMQVCGKSGIDWALPVDELIQDKYWVKVTDAMREARCIQRRYEARGY